jgi:hypothetical protein
MRLDFPHCRGPRIICIGSLLCSIIPEISLLIQIFGDNGLQVRFRQFFSFFTGRLPLLDCFLQTEFALK